MDVRWYASSKGWIIRGLTSGGREIGVSSNFRSSFLLYLHIIRRSPTLVYLLVVAAGAASCHTQELAERFRRTFHAYVQRANTQETKIFLCVFNQSSCYHFAIILSRALPSNFSLFSLSLFFWWTCRKDTFFFKKQAYSFFFLNCLCCIFSRIFMLHASTVEDI